MARDDNLFCGDKAQQRLGNPRLKFWQLLSGEFSLLPITTFLLQPRGSGGLRCHLRHLLQRLPCQKWLMVHRDLSSHLQKVLIYFHLKWSACQPQLVTLHHLVVQSLKPLTLYLHCTPLILAVSRLRPYYLWLVRRCHLRQPAHASVLSVRAARLKAWQHHARAITLELVKRHQALDLLLLAFVTWLKIILRRHLLLQIQLTRIFWLKFVHNARTWSKSEFSYQFKLH